MKKLLLAIAILFSISCVGQKLSLSLPDFIQEWIGTPYRFGGTTKKGIDCSAFAQKLYATVFSLDIPRTCYYQFQATQRVALGELQLGDLLFFKSRLSPSGWHVGVYLGDSTFIHAANRKDNVKISHLDSYYINIFKGGGRIINDKL